MYEINLWLPGKKEGEINWEIEIDTYTLLQTKQITNKDLLYGRGNSIQCSMVTYMGIESKKSIHMYMYNEFTLLYSRN